MISTIAKLLHLPAIETAAELKRLTQQHGHAVDEDAVKAIVIELRNEYDALRAESASLKAHAEALARALGQISAEADRATLHKWDAPLMGLQNAIEDGDAALAAYRKDFP